jgi:glycosyltransferase involved in cell wall biosynthesis
MKILVFSPYYPPHIGGLESHADEFNKYLSQKGIDIAVFTPRLPKEAQEKETKYNGVKIIRFPAFEIVPNYPLPKFWLIKFWELFFSLFKEKFDIVISRTRFFNTSLLAFFYAKIKNVEWIHIEHGSDFVQSGGKFLTSTAKLYDYTFGRLILWSADKVIANSLASSEFCRKLVKDLDCKVIYRGVEMKKIENARPALEIKAQYPDETLIVFIGRLINGKGVLDLIRAVKDIKDDYRLFIIGDGPQKTELENLTAELEIENKVKFFGQMKFEEAIGILKISDILVNPSYTEGLPTSVVEAALCEKAIVATNVGGTREIIIDNQSGFLIAVKDIPALKNKLEILIKDESIRKDFGKNAYAEVLNKFNWNKSVEKYMKNFQK